ncbi:hypothetical protein FT638_15075 [Bacillus cereus]|nr:hypothetical protein [Bacillus cereus]
MLDTIKHVAGSKVLVQKLKDNCNESINLGHTVTITLEGVLNWYGVGFNLSLIKVLLQILIL